MSLILEIVGPQATQLGEAARKAFLQQGGSIGRAAANDWVIPDAYVSGQHARVHFRDGKYFLEDLSTNGVFIKNPGNRLPKGQQYPLHSGDRVFIDAYEIKVTVDGENDLPAPSRPSLFDSVNKQSSVFVTAALERPRNQRAGAAEVNGIPVELTIPLPEPSDAIVDSAVVERIAHSALDIDIGLPEIDFDPFGDPGESGMMKGDEGLFASAMAPSEPPPRLSKSSRSAAKSAKKIPAKNLSLNVPDLSSSISAKLPALDMQALLASVNASVDAGDTSVSLNAIQSEQLSRILPVVIAGIMQMLQAKDKARDEFGIRHTSYKKADNNPLKFSVNVEDALHNLLVKKNAAYLGPVDAFEDAFRDMRCHEQATLEAMRAAFNSMLQEFNPENLQVVFNKEVKQGSLWSGPIKLRYWDLFRERYKQLARNPDQCFHDLFADEFAKVYSARFEQLKLTNTKP